MSTNCWTLVLWRHGAHIRMELVTVEWSALLCALLQAACRCRSGHAFHKRCHTDAAVVLRFPRHVLEYLCSSSTHGSAGVGALACKHDQVRGQKADAGSGRRFRTGGWGQALEGRRLGAAGIEGTVLGAGIEGTMLEQALRGRCWSRR